MKSSRAYINEQVVVNVVLNFGIALFLGWEAMAALEIIPLQAPPASPFDPNMAGDLLVGSLLLGLILTAILTVLVRRTVKNGGVDLSSYAVSGAIAKLPANLGLRALTVGLVAMFVVAMPIVVVMAVLGITDAEPWNYIIAHSFYVAILAGFVANVGVKRALMEQ